MRQRFPNRSQTGSGVYYLLNRSEKGVQKSSTAVEASGTTLLTSNPNYRVQVTKRQNASTSYSRYRVNSWTPVKLDTETVSLPSKGVSSALHSFPIWATGAVDPTVDAIALARFKRELRNIGDTFKALPPIVEARDLHTTVVGMINLTGRFVQGLQAKKGIFRSKRAFIRYAQDSWLTYSFGISPAVRDAANLASSIYSYVSRVDQPNVRIAKGASGYRIGGTMRASSPVLADGFGGSAKALIYNQSVVHYVAGVNAPLRSSNDYGIFDHLGIVPSQIPAALWELKGLSWIVDYFSNMGDFIDDMFYVPTVNMVYLNKTTVDRLNCYTLVDLLIPKDANPGYNVTRASNLGGRFDSVQVSRSIVGALPSTGFRIKTMSEIGKPEYAIGRILNLVSLIKR